MGSLLLLRTNKKLITTDFLWITNKKLPPFFVYF